ATTPSDLSSAVILRPTEARLASLRLEPPSSARLTSRITEGSRTAGQGYTLRRRSMTQDQKSSKPSAASASPASARRFLAQLMEYCFREGWRTPDDFVKFFPASTLMAALKTAPELRVAILASATGMYEEI